MKHSTNYFDTFIEVAEDSTAIFGEVPPLKSDKKSVANLQFEMVHEHPYEYTSDDIFFVVHCNRKELSADSAEREAFFSSGQPCFRASPLTKRYGWGVHNNSEGKVAFYGVESSEYQQFVADDTVKKTAAMRSKRKQQQLFQ